MRFGAEQSSVHILPRINAMTASSVVETPNASPWGSVLPLGCPIRTVGVQMLREHKMSGRTFHNTLTGRSAFPWLTDYCTTIDKHEAVDIASVFVKVRIHFCNYAAQGIHPNT